jgi:hypothetical protein
MEGTVGRLLVILHGHASGIFSQAHRHLESVYRYSTHRVRLRIDRNRIRIHRRTALFAKMHVTSRSSSGIRCGSSALG